VAVPAATHASTGPERLKVVATNLDNPRKLFLAKDGALHVAEAGTGGSDKCFGTGPNAVCVGRSGSVTRVQNGRQRRVVTGLVSWATVSGQRALGPAAVIVRGRAYDVLLDDDTVKPNGTNDLGPDGALAGDLIDVHPGKRGAKVIADLAAFEAAHNPDHGAGPGPKLGNPPIDSDPYAVVPYRGGFAVADAGANDLLWVDPHGRISVLAVFPTQVVKLSKAMAKRMGAPGTMSTLALQSVPSSVAVGPDGALYVGELTARPFPPGKARVWRIVPGRKPELFASGFTNISDLAFDGKDLLVLEIADKGLYNAASTGSLIRVTPGGRRTVLAKNGLVDPTGLAVGRGVIYISNGGVLPGSGPGPHGEIVSVSVP
jgi:hypothetical protein